MSFQIDSRIFEFQDQNTYKQLFIFLSLEFQSDGQQFSFKDEKQQEKFLKFKTAFDNLKEMFPNFKVKLKPKFQTNQQYQNKSQQKEQSEFALKNSSTQINSDQSLRNSKTEQSLQKSLGIQSFQGDNDSQKVQIQQKVSINNHEDNYTHQLNQQQQDLISIISEIDQSNFDSSFQFSLNSLILNSTLDSSIIEYDDKIKIKYHDKTFTIQLKNNFILQIIEQLYLEQWNLLIKQLNLIKQSMNSYKLQQNTDFYFLNQEIQTFIEKIQLIEIQFCYHSCYTMKQQQSKMNIFLQLHQIYIAQIGDNFYLVSKQQSQQFLQDILLQIYENYRGYILHYANAKPYSNYIENNPIMANSRYLYYKKYLATDVKQYSFHQYLNENFFFFEMNFAQIQENREIVEKQIKQYVGGFLKNLFLLQFSIKSTFELEQKFEKLFQNSIESLKLKILFYKNNDNLILFGINDDIRKLLSHLERQDFTIKFMKTLIELDKDNYLFKLKGTQQKIDLDSIIALLQKFGFQQDDPKKLAFSTVINTGLNYLHLIQILKILCDFREQNNNRLTLQTFHQKFRISIDQKDLKKDITFLSLINPNNIQQLSEQQQVMTLNVRSELQQFSISETISLNPKFLDEIIIDNLDQDFRNNLVLNNQKLQFQKISQGKYQLQCMNKEIVTQFQQYFNKFQTVILDLDQNSLTCFELSHFLKKELKKRFIYWKIIDQKKLYLITRHTEFLKYAQEFNQYKGKIIYMISLDSKYLNEKIEYYQLVLARTNYFKYKLCDFLKSLFQQIKEIEFREEQEISSFCIIHSNYINQEQYLIQCFQYIQKLIGSKIFIEIKTIPQVGQIFLEKINSIKDLYISQIQQYSDYYITILGNKQHFQQINQLIQKIYIPDEQATNLHVSFYIEQFIPYKNIVQKTQHREKFKVYLERQGFTLLDTNSKWKIEIKQKISKLTIFSYLAEYINQESTQMIKNYDLLNLESVQFSVIQQNSQLNLIQDIDQTLLEFLENENNQNNYYESNVLEKINQNDNFKNQILNNKQIITQSLQNMTDSQFQNEHSDQSLNQDLPILAEFQNSIQQIQFPQISKAIKIIIEQNFSNYNFLFFEPYVDQNYKNNFLKQEFQCTELYVVQKLKKVFYQGTFSKKIIFWTNPKTAIEKFIHQNHHQVKQIMQICISQRGQRKDLLNGRQLNIAISFYKRKMIQSLFNFIYFLIIIIKRLYYQFLI
ncbi:unnamed protein product [Paramecium sonneborni]|uniref:Transmembrane protein n=1 Tax=Paramecium sonneborni TaxID=65129 RepID=A0A8S1KV58_9CILI|nr:unnamed protein product [Paramecium sonneborni]